MSGTDHPAAPGAPHPPAGPPGARRHALAEAAAALPQQLLIGAVRGYRFWFKPWLGNACRFEPTCSAYALQALAQHGAARGAWLSGARLLRCHPWCDGGFDPVPPPPSRSRPPAAQAAAASSVPSSSSRSDPPRLLPAADPDRLPPNPSSP